MTSVHCGYLLSNIVVLVFVIYILTMGTFFIRLGVTLVGGIYVALAFVTMFVVLIGFIGLFCVNRICLFLYIVLISLLLLVHTAIISIPNRNDTYEIYIEERLRQIFHYNRNMFHTIEKSYVCCGIKKWQDYNESMTIPNSCCSLSGQIPERCLGEAKNRKGCKDTVFLYFRLLKQKTDGFIVFVMFVYICLIILAVYAYNSVYTIRDE